jgi:hypothetical protein
MKFRNAKKGLANPFTMSVLALGLVTPFPPRRRIRRLRHHLTQLMFSRRIRRVSRSRIRSFIGTQRNRRIPKSRG